MIYKFYIIIYNIIIYIFQLFYYIIKLNNLKKLVNYKK